ncbi:MAG: sulfatase-like hydrolase/transferase [Candidatus Nanopelagicales bacterium]|nr:sulfatase-like hydrolase/transferase [Candidatus Nanopelagicales bacterium]
MPSLQQSGRLWRDIVAAIVVVTILILATLAWVLLGSTADQLPLGAPGQGTGISTSAPGPHTIRQPTRANSASGIKNVVLLLADGLDWAAFNQVPRLAALKAQGTTLSDFVVTDSLCCPSRTSLLRSQFVHNHQVLSNVAKTGGGWATFYARNLQQDCLPTWLHNAGIRTSLIGKYINGYPKTAPTTTYIPPGWDYFMSSTSGVQAYQGYNYTLNVNGQSRDFGAQPTDFMNDVLTNEAVQQLASSDAPFFLELATYNPHTPAPVATRNQATHQSDSVPRTPAFNTAGTNEVRWLAGHPVNMPAQVDHFDALWRRRLASAESVAGSYDALVAQLHATGRDQDTLTIVTSDNGYHAGVRLLSTGKNTAFHEDSVVPAVFIGPGIDQGRAYPSMGRWPRSHAPAHESRSHPLAHGHTD